MRLTISEKKQKQLYAYVATQWTGMRVVELSSRVLINVMVCMLLVYR